MLAAKFPNGVHPHGISVREAALTLAEVCAGQFDLSVDVSKMLGNHLE